MTFAHGEGGDGGGESEASPSQKMLTFVTQARANIITFFAATASVRVLLEETVFSTHKKLDQTGLN